MSEENEKIGEEYTKWEAPKTGGTFDMDKFTLDDLMSVNAGFDEEKTKAIPPQYHYKIAKLLIDEGAGHILREKLYCFHGLKENEVEEIKKIVGESEY